MEKTEHRHRNVGFTPESPKSGLWRQAWKRFCDRYHNLPARVELKQLQEDHHSGWRGGVDHVRKGFSGSAYYTEGTKSRERIRAWEHGALCGSRSARKYLADSGKSCQNLK